MTEVAAILLTVIFFVLTGVLVVLTAVLFILYRLHQKMVIVEDTQNVIFAASTNAEEYYKSITDGERITFTAN
tara:strand:- start:26 stop:244 length:219 start_codon:yes stop_codon:yes gene_type:complete